MQVSFGYGLTETSSGVAISVPGGSSFDPFALAVCPEDTVALASDGEILISSPSCMMKGYYKHPEDTAAVLKGNLLFTGDIGKWDENGRLHVIGRKKEILSLYSPTAPRSFFPSTKRVFSQLFPDAISPFLRETESRYFCSSTRNHPPGQKRCASCRAPWYRKNCAALCLSFRADSSSARSCSRISRSPAPRPAR